MSLLTEGGVNNFSHLGVRANDFVRKFSANSSQPAPNDPLISTFLSKYLMNL